MVMFTGCKIAESKMKRSETRFVSFENLVLRYPFLFLVSNSS